MNTFAQEYLGVLDQVINMPDFVCKPRGKEVKELLPGDVHIDPIHCFFKNPKRDFNKIMTYLVGETMWYFGGRNDLAFIDRYASLWKKIANEDGTCNSAYGNLIFKMKDAKSEYQVSEGKSQWEWAFESLVTDKDTRQAIMHFNRPVHQYSENLDFVCTCYANFHIRDNKLHMISRMRSQDIFMGLTYDVPFFSLLQQNMCLLLRKSAYPTLELGRLLHSSDSLHLYARDYEIAREMLHSESFSVTITLPKPLVDEHGNPTNFYTDLTTVAFSAHESNEAALLGFRLLGGDA